MTGMIDLNPRYLVIVERILSEHVPKCEVRAFGSRASWTAKDYSDLDLAIVGDGPLDWRTLGLLKEAFEESDLPMRVDVLDWHDIPESFQRAIARGYVVLHNDAERTIPAEWQEVTLDALCDFRAGSVFKTEYQGESEGDYPFIKVSDMNIPSNRFSINKANNWVSQSIANALGAKPFPVGTVVFAKIGEALKYNRLRIITQPTIIDNNMMGAIPKVGKVDSRFLLYAMSQFDLGQISSGTALPYLTVHSLAQLRVPLPSLPEQRAIAHVLGTLDDKIELNRRTNETLGEMAGALFRSWFVDFEPVRAKMEGRDTGLPSDLAALFPDRLVPSELGEIPENWEVKALDSIATFLNGLALQKYPATDGSALPVIKIAQLRAGHTQGADLASGDLPEEYKVNDGDVLFSWSGSLELAIWAGGQGALNQHLFKVTSQGYPQWLYYFWVWEHLPEFREIAADKATTMGHIQRHHLSEALAVVPDAAMLEGMNRHMQPFFNRSLSLRLASCAIATQRDALLPRLVSGELRIST